MSYKISLDLEDKEIGLGYDVSEEDLEVLYWVFHRRLVVDLNGRDCVIIKLTVTPRQNPQVKRAWVTIESMPSGKQSKPA